MTENSNVTNRNKKRLVSIVTPSYNQGKFIEETIQSILSQDYPNIEYIIIDGGSTDSSIDIIKRYEQDIAYWVSEPDSGISDAFNKGIKASKGDIIGIINVGDRYTEEAISTIVNVLNESADFDFVYGDLMYIDEKGNPLFLMKGDQGYQKKIRYTMPALNHPTVFMKRSVYDSCGLFDISYKIAMDYELLLRITQSGKKGLYIERTLAAMTLGGISYERFYKGYKEVCSASITYGYNPVKAYFRLYLKAVRGLVREMLEIFGLSLFIRPVRRIFWNVRPY